MSGGAQITRCDHVVLGAGISGLATAFRLARAGRRVLLAERQNRVAGVIESRKVNGFLLENGPNSFTSFPLDVMELIDEVGLRDRAMLQPLRDNDRFVWREGLLRKVPMGPLELLGSNVLSFGQKVGAARGLFKRLPPPKDDLPVGEYFRPRVGDAPVEYLLKPFLSGVYAANADRVSFEATFPKLFHPATRHDRLMDVLKDLKNSRAPGPRPKRSLVSFLEGLREFPEGIARAFEENGGTLRLNVGAQISSVPSASHWRVDLGGEIAETPSLVLAVPAPEAAELLAGVAPEAAAVLKEIEYAPLAVVHVGAREEQMAESRRGFGFLSVEAQNVNALGMIWSDRIFAGRAPAGHRLLTCFYGGEKHPEAMGWDDATLRSRLVDDLRRAMGFRGGDFALLEITRWQRALPIFRVGHMRGIERARGALPGGIELVGNYLGGVSISDRVASANALEQRLVAESPVGSPRLSVSSS